MLKSPRTNILWLSTKGSDSRVSNSNSYLAIVKPGGDQTQPHEQNGRNYL